MNSLCWFGRWLQVSSIWCQCHLELKTYFDQKQCNHHPRRSRQPTSWLHCSPWCFMSYTICRYPSSIHIKICLLFQTRPHQLSQVTLIFNFLGVNQVNLCHLKSWSYGQRVWKQYRYIASSMWDWNVNIYPIPLGMEDAVPPQNEFNCWQLLFPSN